MSRDVKMEWGLCCLCQEDTRERLESTLDSRFMLAKNIPQFDDLNCMPIAFNPAQLDDGDGISNTLERNRARYHKTCIYKFATSKLDRKKEFLSNVGEAKFKCRSHQKAEDPNKIKVGQCFICDKPALLKNLRQAVSVHEKLRRCAINLQDDRLLVKLSAEDRTSQDLRYHTLCLVGVYNRERAWLNSQKPDDGRAKFRRESVAHAFADLEMFVREKQASTDGCCYFRMVELYELYTQRLKQLNYDGAFAHKTRLKEQILDRIPELEAFQKGRELWFVYKKVVGDALTTA